MAASSQLTDPRSLTLDDSDRVLNGSDEVVRGVFEPPGGFALSAIARNKLLVLTLAVVLGLAGLALGYSRQRIFTASATLQIGQVNPNSPGFYGYVQSAAALATAFSHAIESEQVLATVQHKLKMPPAAAVVKLSAEPLPQSPAMRIIATGRSEAAAIRLANVASNALVAYESESNSANPQASSLLHEYTQQAAVLQRAAVQLSQLNQSKHASPEALVHDEANRNAAEVKLKAIGLAYTQTVSSEAPRSGLVSLIAAAVHASSDRRPKMELYGLIGLLVGLVFGCGAALARERRRRSRAGLAATETLHKPAAA